MRSISKSTSVSLMLMLGIVIAIASSDPGTANADVPEYRQAYHTCHIVGGSIPTKYGSIWYRHVRLSFGCKRLNWRIATYVEYYGPFERDHYTGIISGGDGGSSLKGCSVDVWGGNGFPMYTAIKCKSRYGRGKIRSNIWEARGENIDGAIVGSYLEKHYDEILP